MVIITLTDSAAAGPRFPYPRQHARDLTVITRKDLAISQHHNYSTTNTKYIYSDGEVFHTEFYFGIYFYNNPAVRSIKANIYSKKYIKILLVGGLLYKFNYNGTCALVSNRCTSRTSDIYIMLCTILQPFDQKYSSSFSHLYKVSQLIPAKYSAPPNSRSYFVYKHYVIIIDQGITIYNNDRTFKIEEQDMTITSRWPPREIYINSSALAKVLQTSSLMKRCVKIYRGELIEFDDEIIIRGINEIFDELEALKLNAACQDTFSNTFDELLAAAGEVMVCNSPIPTTSPRSPMSDVE